MRCFIAIDIDESIKAALADLQDEIIAASGVRRGDVKRVRPEAMHLTLKFLGEIRDQQLVEVCNAVSEVAARHATFDLGVETVGCFGGRSARVVWVGAGLECEELSNLQSDLEQVSASIGFAPEARKFSGHLTLFRIRNARAGLKLAGLVERYRDFGLGSVRADSVSVYQSELRPQGPLYTRLGNFELSLKS